MIKEACVGSFQEAVLAEKTERIVLNSVIIFWKGNNSLLRLYENGGTISQHSYLCHDSP